MPTAIPSPLRRRAALAGLALTLWGVAACGRTPVEPPAPPDRIQCKKADNNECFVQIPGGTFLMGAQATDPNAPGYDPLASASEGPVHEVTVAPFWLMRSEVTVSTAQRCITSSQCPADLARTGGAYTNLNHADRTHFSLNAIRWDAADKLCRFLGGRLPTEAEWEFAARAGEARRWPWGDKPLCGVLQVAGATARTPEMAEPPCVNEGTIPIDARALATGYGLAALSGNVAEWTADLWTIYGEDPAPGESRHVLRGGSWVSQDPADLRTTARAPGPADEEGPDVGLRCAWGAE